MSNLLDACTELYWSFAEYGIDDRRRMKAVLYHLAEEVRTWAPDESQARICFLMTNGQSTVASWWDGYLRACDHILEADGQ